MPPKSAEDCRRRARRHPASGSRTARPENAGSKVVVADKPKIDFTLPAVAKGKPAGPPPMPPATCAPSRSSGGPRHGRHGAGRQPVGAAGRRRRAEAGPALQHRHAGTARRPAVPRGDAQRPEVQPQRQPAPGRRRPRGQVGPGRRLDVPKAERLFEVGEEYDAVLAADISPDQTRDRAGRAEQGGPHLLDEGRRAASTRSTSTPTGSRALEFSPDGVLLATGDRNGGLFVWEAFTGREYLHPPGAHRGDHRRHLAARLQRRRLGERGRHGPALGDGERQPDTHLGCPRRRLASPCLRQGRPARHARPRQAGEVCGTATARNTRNFEPFADVASEGGVHPRCSARDRGRLDRAGRRVDRRRRQEGGRIDGESARRGRSTGAGRRLASRKSRRHTIRLQRRRRYPRRR